MTRDEKRWIVLLVAVLVIAIGLIIGLAKSKNVNKEEQKENVTNIEQIQNEEYVEVLDDGTKVNTSNKLKEDKEFNGLKISNISIEEKGNETVLEADITNISSKSQGDYGIYLVIKDDEGNEIKKIAGYINHIEPNEETKLKIKTSYDFANAYDFEIEEQ